MMRFGVHRQHGRKRIAALAASCVVVAVALLGFPPHSFADADRTGALELTVSQEVRGRAADADVTVRYELRADDPGSPMPDSSPAYGFSLTNDQTLVLPAIRFQATGTYTYALDAISAAGGASGVELDANRYTIAVHVVDHGSIGVEMQPIFKDADGYKTASLRFAHTAPAAPVDPADPIGPEGPASPGDPIGSIGIGSFAPKTGDQIVAASLLLLLLLAAAAVAASEVHRRRKRGESYGDSVQH